VNDVAARAHSVTISAAAEDESMNHRARPGRRLGLVEHTVDHAFLAIFWMFPDVLGNSVMAGNCMYRLLNCGFGCTLILFFDVLAKSLKYAR